MAFTLQELGIKLAGYMAFEHFPMVLTTGKDN
jgi:hypothetical protein